MTPAPVDRFRRSVGRLTTLLSYWTPSRFAAAASPLVAEAVTGLSATAAPATTVGDALHVVAQSLADVAADAEGRARRPVPRLPEPGVIADQLAVLANDIVLVGVAAETLDALTDRLDALRAAL